MRELDSMPQPKMLLTDDFKAYSKLKVENHAFNRTSLPGHYKVKEYCPLVFRALRERFGVNEVILLIAPFLERIRLEHIETKCSPDSKLNFESICSIRIRSRKRDIDQNVDP